MWAVIVNGPVLRGHSRAAPTRIHFGSSPPVLSLDLTDDLGVTFPKVRMHWEDLSFFQD